MALWDRTKRTAGSYLSGAAVHSEPDSAKHENTSPFKAVSAKGEENRLHDAVDVSASFIRFKVAPHGTNTINLGLASRQMSGEQVLAKVWQADCMESKRCKGFSYSLSYLFTK